jgi:hypothetical protein
VAVERALVGYMATLSELEGSLIDGRDLRDDAENALGEIRSARIAAGMGIGDVSIRVDPIKGVIS